MSDLNKRRCAWCGKSRAEHTERPAPDSRFGTVADLLCPDRGPESSQFWTPRVDDEAFDRLAVTAETGIRGVLVDPGDLSLLVKMLGEARAEAERLQAYFRDQDAGLTHWLNDEIRAGKAHLEKCFLTEAERRMAADLAVADLKALIRHCRIYSGYRDCGRSHMTSEQQKLYDAVVEEQEEGE